MKNLLQMSIWTNVYEGENLPAPAPAADATPPPPAPDAGNPPADTFNQADVERMIQQRLRKQSEAQKTLVGELNALKAKADLTADERSDWETRVQTLNNSLLSEKELAAKESKRRLDEHAQIVLSKDSQITDWKDRFTQSTIQRSLTDAAVESKAFYPEQIVNMLDRNTRIVEELLDGKPTGRLIPKVRFEDISDDGKPVTLDLSPVAAVKRMTEIGKYQNLFEGKGIGGVGSRNHPDGGQKQNLANQAKDIGSYIQGRRDGTITL